MVGDVIASAFDSAGQRCSALRVLCLQDDVADRMLAMLKGALHELEIGRTDRLAVDVGPVITAEAKGIIEKHIAAMRGIGAKVEQIALSPATGERHLRAADDHRAREALRPEARGLRPGAARASATSATISTG